MPGLTLDQVNQLAPDPAALKNAQGLANLARWLDPSADEAALWGECKGSGEKPYCVCVDLADFASTCTCPSRKFPCKHALALLLLSATEALKLASRPVWAEDWLAKRAARRAADKLTPPAESLKKVDARQKDVDRRKANRSTLADSGIAALELWLKDLARMGLAAAQTAPAAFWQEQSARMVDSQMPGAARLIRELSQLPGSRPDWAEVFLLRLGRLYLLTQAYQKLDTLSQPVQQDIQRLLGWTVSQKELLASGEGIQDDWLVMAVRVEDDEESGLRTQSAWLYGRRSRRIALILNFAYRNQPLDSSLVAGRVIGGSLVFFPGAFPIRALFKDRLGERASFVPKGCARLAEFQDEFAEALGKYPWLDLFPVVLQDVRPVLRETEPKWLLLDTQCQALPVTPRYSRIWELYALSGGQPLTVFGIWDAFYFSPMAVWAKERYVWL